jgi:hypothetical protein
LSPSKAFLSILEDEADVVLCAQVGNVYENFYEVVPFMPPAQGTGYTRRDSNILGGKEAVKSWVLNTAKWQPKFAPEVDNPPAKPALAHQITASDDGWTYRRKIIAKGKAVGPIKKVFKHKNKLQALIAEAIILGDAQAGPPAQKYNVIIVWQKKINESKHELWAHFLKIK